MSFEVVISIIAILVSIGIFYAGYKLGERQECDRRSHERQMEHERRQSELVSKVAEQYADMAKKHYDNGPHALARLGLDSLGRDALIRQAIKEMQVLSADDPWGGKAECVAGIDLVKFFRYVRVNRIDFFKTSIEEVATRVRRQTDSGS